MERYCSVSFRTRLARRARVRPLSRVSSASSGEDATCISSFFCSSRRLSSSFWTMLRRIWLVRSISWLRSFSRARKMPPLRATVRVRMIP